MTSKSGKNRKHLALALVFAVLMTVLIMPFDAMAADVQLAEEHFDSAQLSNCWEAGADSGVVDGVFKSGATNWNTLSFTPSGGVVVYRFKFMQPVAITADICRGLSASGNAIGFRVFTSDGNIQLERNGHSVITLMSGYAANTWYDICVETPYAEAGTAYVNGAAAGNFYALEDVGGTFGKMQTFNRENGTTYFDDIEISAFPSRAAADVAVNAENSLITVFDRYGTKGAENLKKVVNEYKYVLSDDEATEDEITAAKNEITNGYYANTRIYQDGSNYVHSYRYASEPITNIAVIETNFKLRANGYQMRIQQVWNSAGTARPFILVANTVGTGNLVINNGTSAGTLSTDVAGGVWHNLISVADIPNKHLSIYFDGKLVYDGTGFYQDVSDIGLVDMQTETTYAECFIGGPVLIRGFDDLDAVTAYIEAENELDKSGASLKEGYAGLKEAYNAVDAAYIWHRGNYDDAANNLIAALTEFKDANFAISSRFADENGNTITSIGENEIVIAKVEATHCDNYKKPVMLIVAKYVNNTLNSIELFDSFEIFKGDSTNLSAAIETEPNSGEIYAIFVWADGSLAPLTNVASID